MKSAAWVFAPLVLALAAGCGGDSPPDGPRVPARVRIAFIVKTPESPWMQAELLGARKCSERFGFDLFTTPGDDAEQLLNAMDSLAKTGVQGLIISPPAGDLGPAIMAKAKVRGLKVIAVDDRLVDIDNAPVPVPFVGASDRAVGRTVGKALHREFAKRAWPAGETAACVVTFDEVPVFKERTDGAAYALAAAGFPTHSVRRSPARTTDPDAAANAADRVLTGHPEVKRWLVFSWSDTAVIAAVRVLERHGFDKNAVIGIGIGGRDARAVFDKDEPPGFAATCLISPQAQGYKAAEFLFKWINHGVEPPMDTRTSGAIVTRQNYKTFLAE